MSKRRKRQRKSEVQPAGRHERSFGPNADSLSNPTARNACLDSLRGLAIVLMIVDHVAAVLLNLRIDDSWIRLLTRLSMPLFCVLMGFFLVPERRRGAKRLVQIAVAAVIANLVFWPHYHRFEILGSLLVAYVLFLIAGRAFPIFALSLLLFPDDPLREWFDYPLSIVVAFVAQGTILRRFGIIAALVSGIAMSSGAIWVHLVDPEGVHHMLFYFLLPATLLVYFGQSHPERRIPGLDWLGRHPLSIYVLQYYVIFAIAYGLLYYRLSAQ